MLKPVLLHPHSGWIFLRDKKPGSIRYRTGLFEPMQHSAILADLEIGLPNCFSEDVLIYIMTYPSPTVLI